jgi:hypothetical protein
VVKADIFVCSDLVLKTGYLGLLWFFSVAENIFFGGPDDQVDLDDYF